ncbi:Pentatricopeptide repeat [Macleaya cordata]|uniref:Pentatricopeptide repeat n=1 Tax=Macleaya cordata TaxID=56857 RepID=A0A200QLW2_MACCD|nr:Pentatricopeptide repeat [Macleaya cordata]
MKRVWKISDKAKAELILQRCSIKPKSLIHPSSLLKRSSNRSFIGEISVQTRCFCSNDFPKIINLFTEKPGFWGFNEEARLITKVSELRDELIEYIYDSEKIEEILKFKVDYLFRSYPCGSASIELFNQLKLWPQLALQVFNWRRKQAHDEGVPMASEEYAKGIMIAGRVKDVDLAVKLFEEASSLGIITASTYNALMAAYMYNGLDVKSRLLFSDLKRDVNCRPTIVTYNILISLFGRLVLVKHMEETFREVMELKLSPNLNTYNNLIAGYVTAWMWEDMERTYKIMEEGSIKPDLNTHLLMLRGYAHSCQLDKMENTYKLVKHYVNDKEVPLIRAMICAYCKSSDADRVRKIEALVKLIPEEEYRPWLNVLLIRVYAQENLMEDMQSYIREAFERKTSVTKRGVMRSIITSYFHCNAVEELAKFVKQAESAGWKICRSLYHCKMVMYASHNRLEEMENVLDEMERFHLDPTKKTFMIMYKAYTKCGQRSKVERLLGVMCKHGFGIPLDALPS